MAKMIESFEFTDKRSKYDWTAWFNGKIWELTKGEDFESKSFESSARGAAKRLGFSIRFNTINEGNAVVLQATKIEKPSEALKDHGG